MILIRLFIRTLGDNGCLDSFLLTLKSVFLIRDLILKCNVVQCSVIQTSILVAPGKNISYAVCGDPITSRSGTLVRPST